VSLVGQRGTGGFQLLRAAASAGPSVPKGEAAGVGRNAGVCESCAPEGRLSGQKPVLANLLGLVS